MLSAPRGAALFVRRLACLNNEPSSLSMKPTDFPIHDQRRCKSTLTDFADTLVMSGPVKVAEKIFISVHDFSGLPWWGSILVTTIGYRVAFSLPLAILTARNNAKLMKLEPEGKQILADVRREIAVIHRVQKLTEGAAKAKFNMRVKDEFGKLYVANNCHPTKSLIAGLIQIPLLITFTIGLSSLSKNIYYMSDWSEGGLAWFANLTQPDPFFILGPLLGIVNIATLEAGFLQRAPGTEKQELKFKVTKYAYRTLSGLFIVVGCIAPSGVTFYWLCNATLNAAQRALTMSPRFKSIIGLPKLPTDDPHPYRSLYERFRGGFAEKPRMYVAKK